MRKNKFDVKTVVKAALLAGLSVVLTRFLAIMPTPALRISAGPMPIMLSGVAFGPVVGGAVGLVSDLIGVLINPQGTPHLGFTLSSILTGVIPALTVMAGDKRGVKKIISALIGSVLVVLIVHIGLNSYWLSQLMGKSFAVMMPTRALKCVLEGAFNYILIALLLKANEKNSFL